MDRAKDVVDSLGRKGVVFVLLCILLIPFGILSCFGQVFGIVMGVWAFLLAIGGIYSIYRRDMRGLFVCMFCSAILALMAVLNFFVLPIQYRVVLGTPYIGFAGLLVLGVALAILAWDGRGRSLSWNATGSSSNDNTPAPAPATVSNPTPAP
eukprot:TRINITY_DN21776_c0_g1_i1.p1 TRINITY_DN21776_c0_g1~~TRINITY_DN21776_c0_g1_i1.p1  ORF type:complete len:161 (-),score=3.22 TRINITY_DN21776_c0_g1_i1:45-500(-)